MNKPAHPKEQVPPSGCLWPRQHGVVGMLLTVCLSGATPFVHADMVYRCGDAYSSFAQCASGPAVEVKPSLDWVTSNPGKTRTASQDLREAQALEKQRLQADYQAAQTAPVRQSTPNAEVAPATHAAPTAHRGQGKTHHRSTPNPYFTAKDPSALVQKKGSAKVAPATQTASPP